MDSNNLFKRRVTRVRTLEKVGEGLSRNRLNPFTPKGKTTTTTTISTSTSTTKSTTASASFGSPKTVVRARTRLRSPISSRSRYVPSAAPIVQTTTSKRPRRLPPFHSSVSDSDSTSSEGEEAEKMQVSTQTSRSVVVVARARAKNKQNEVRYTPQISKAAAAILGNVTRATPTGIRKLLKEGGMENIFA